MAIAKHIQVANTLGAKAGFKAYMATSAPTAAERQAEIRSAGNSKAQFVAYCDIFGDQLKGPKATAAVSSKSDDERASTIERVLRLLGKDGSADSDDDTPGASIQVVEDEPEAPSIDELTTDELLDLLVARLQGDEVPASKPSKARNTRRANTGGSLEFTYNGNSHWVVISETKTRYRARKDDGRESNFKKSTFDKLRKQGIIVVL